MDKNPYNLLSIFAHFEAATKAQLPSDANPYTFKWNFHMGTNADGTDTCTARELFSSWAAHMRTQTVVEP